MTSEEKAKAIRAELKKAGFSSRQISVRLISCGYSSAFRITIKDGNISQLQIEDICNKYKEVEYDERTGEILEGGNTYVTVQRDYRLPLDGSEYLDAVKNALAKLEREGQGEKIEGTRWILFKERGEYFGICSAYSKLDYMGNHHSVSRFRLREWAGVYEDIARAIKSRELDAAYLARKSA